MHQQFILVAVHRHLVLVVLEECFYPPPPLILRALVAMSTRVDLSHIISIIQ